MTDRTPLKMLMETTELEQSALIDLYVVDLRPVGGDLLRFHSGKNEILEDVVWQGNTFGAYPVQASGFEFNGKGTSNRPTLTFSNVFGTITGLNQSFDDLVGIQVTRKQVYAKYLDAVNFLSGNPFADPTQEVVSRYFIEQLQSLDDVIASYSLSIPIDLEGALLPKRQITSNVCTWVYRSPECSYTGGPVADETDKPTSDPAKDQCSKCLNGCKLRFGENNILPIGAFLSII